MSNRDDSLRALEQKRRFFEAAFLRPLWHKLIAQVREDAERRTGARPVTEGER